MKLVPQASLVAVALFCGLIRAASFTAPFPPTQSQSYLSHLSADGSTITGIFNYLGPGERNVHWTAATGMTTIPKPSGSWSTSLYDLSDDGSVVTFNSSYYPEDRSISYRWSASTGLIPLDTGDAVSNLAYAISGDKRFIVGAINGQTNQAARWDENGNVQLLGIPTGRLGSYAWAVSQNGSVIGGTALSGDPGEAFRWTPTTGMQTLGYLKTSDNLSAVTAVSRDGTTLVGISGGEDAYLSTPFRWTEATGMLALADIIGATPNFVSPDGSVIVGAIHRNTGPGSSSRQTPFRWTASGGFVDLGHPANATDVATYAFDMSADGSVLVGMSGSGTSDDSFRAVIWDEQNGWQYLQDYLTDLGLDLTGWQLRDATGISADGLTIAGGGFHNGRTDVWMATIPEPAAALMLLVPVQMILRRNGNSSAIRKEILPPFGRQTLIVQTPAGGVL